MPPLITPADRPIPVIRRSPAAARAVEDILGLPEGSSWNNINVYFGHEPAYATLDILLTAEQVIRLAEVLG